jgi:pterin-4a-carbinolamine dehydratase
MMNIKKLHTEYFDKQFKSSKYSLPVVPKQTDTPILPTSKWQIKDSFLVKKFNFMEASNRNEFIFELLAYENKTNHHAILTVEEESVEIKLITKNIQQVTSIDKEYAKFADVLFKDLAYNHGT